jgi:hypothetical protein
VRVNRATRERKSAFYGGLWGFLGDYGHLRNLTTNQKVAGSSPAERATKSPANGETRKQWETIAPILPATTSPSVGFSTVAVISTSG